MGNRRYTLELKIKFLDAFERLGSVAGAAREIGLETADVCAYWVKHKDDLRESYELSTKPIIPVRRTGHAPTRIPLEEKIRCIEAIEAGLSVHQASIEFDRSLSTVQSWYKAKDGLLVLYYSRQNPDASADVSAGIPSAQEAAWEIQTAKEQADEDLVKRCKALAKENEYLKDRVMFLEKLNGILKQRSGPVKKKNLSLRSSCASRQEDEGT